MPYPTTGPNTELQAVNQILASVGQAPVNTLTTETTYVIESTGTFTGSISGTTLTTTESDIAVGTFLSGASIINNTSVATAGVVEAIAPQVQVTSGDVSTIYQGDVILGRLAMGADYLNPAAAVELFAGTATKPAGF